MENLLIISEEVLNSTNPLGSFDEGMNIPKERREELDNILENCFSGNIPEIKNKVDGSDEEKVSTLKMLKYCELQSKNTNEYTYLVFSVGNLIAQLM